MKIAYPYPSYWPYVRRGAERCIHDLSGYLAGQGHEVEIITSTPGRPRVDYDGDVKVTYLRQISHPLMYQYIPRFRTRRTAWTRAARPRARATGCRAPPELLVRQPRPVAADDARHAVCVPRHHAQPLLGARLHQRLAYANLIRSADIVFALTQGGAGRDHRRARCAVRGAVAAGRHPALQAGGAARHDQPDRALPGRPGRPAQGRAAVVQGVEPGARRMPEARLASRARWVWPATRRTGGSGCSVSCSSSRSRGAAGGDRLPRSRRPRRSAALVRGSVRQPFCLRSRKRSASCSSRASRAARRSWRVRSTVPVRSSPIRVSAPRSRCATGRISTTPNSSTISPDAVLTAIDLSRRPETVDACRAHADQSSLSGPRRARRGHALIDRRGPPFPSPAVRMSATTRSCPRPRELAPPSPTPSFTISPTRVR